MKRLSNLTFAQCSCMPNNFLGGNIFCHSEDDSELQYQENRRKWMCCHAMTKFSVKRDIKLWRSSTSGRTGNVNITSPLWALPLIFGGSWVTLPWREFFFSPTFGDYFFLSWMESSWQLKPLLLGIISHKLEAITLQPMLEGMETMYCYRTKCCCGSLH